MKREPPESPSPKSGPTWSVFKPTRADARLVGVCGTCLDAILLSRAGVREIYLVEGTAAHYREKHGADLDIEKAETMLTSLFADPLMVSEGKKGELMFFGEYDAAYYLVVPVKVLTGELWVSSLFKDNRVRAERKWGVASRLLYKKRG